MPLQKQVKCESCAQYFLRRLREGWKCIKLDYPIATLLSPDRIIKRVDLQNDVETLRPNAAGDLTQITYQFPASGAHWDKVDEEVADDNTTRVYIDGTESVLTDIYHLPAHSGSGPITSVVIYVRAGAEAFAEGKLRIMHKTHGTLYQSGEASLTSSWTTFSTTLTNNPYTSSAWTWAEVDALQIGAKIRDALEWYEVGVTQVYVEVNYTPIVNKNSSDTGSGVDALVSGNPLAIHAKSDTGAGTDAVPSGNPLATLIKSDAGAGVDAKASGNPLAAIVRSETGAGADVILARLLGFTDQGAGTEAISDLLATFLKTDSGTGVDAITMVSNIIYSSDLGTGVDALTALLGEIIRSDSGLGTESLGSRQFGSADTGTGIDAISELLATFLKSDSGAGIDALSVLLGFLIKSDTGAGEDAILSRLLDSADTGAGVDAILSRLLEFADTGTGVDEVSGLLATLLKSDSGVGVDNISELLAAILRSDTGVGTEAYIKVICIFLLLKLFQKNTVNITLFQRNTINITLSQE